MTTSPSHAAVLRLCREFIRIDSQNPPGDTRTMAQAVASALEHPAIEVTLHEPQPGIVNLVAVLRGARPGPRVVFNGHLDTFPIGPTEGWTHDPLGAEQVGDRIYGRGAGDMKAGLAIMVQVMRTLAERRGELHGELVLTAVGDEETGGRWGTRWLLAQVPQARGDYLLNADAGHPRVVRYGEKGVVWLRLASRGRACHGAHVHLGDNALESLMAAVADVLALRERPVELDEALLASMRAARSVSEQEGGAGEFDNMRSITVNLGAMHGGQVANLVPGQAEALIDIRYPPGLTGVQVLSMVEQALAPHGKVQWQAIDGSQTEPAFTDPDGRLVQCFLQHARRIAAPEVVANMRVGLTDARLFRHAGMPAVVYGPRAMNMGGTDEHVFAQELAQVFDVHLAVAGELLGGPAD
ncbi:MAG: M20/M25/M40 family metallo-hydrolase [Proteobacteria bacterium]|nr:M20/M25/M40 family metallo-hydrolase [Pseudomonadota bacterium]